MTRIARDRIKVRWARRNNYKLIIIRFDVDIEAYLEKRLAHLLPAKSKAA
jgi:hypothetical protein